MPAPCREGDELRRLTVAGSRAVACGERERELVWGAARSREEAG